jgi:hypothetical protein
MDKICALCNGMEEIFRAKEYKKESDKRKFNTRSTVKDKYINK